MTRIPETVKLLTRLDTLELTEYIENCRTWAYEFLELNPLPGAA